MHRRQFSGARNKLDLNDRVQVRILRKRLKVSHEQLAGLVRTAGDDRGSQQGSWRSAASYTDRRRMPSAEVIFSTNERARADARASG